MLQETIYIYTLQIAQKGLFGTVLKGRVYVNRTIECKINVFSTRRSFHISMKHLLFSKAPNFLLRLKFTLSAATNCEVNFNFLQYDLYVQIIFVAIFIYIYIYIYISFKTLVHLLEVSKKKEGMEGRYGRKV